MHRRTKRIKTIFNSFVM